MLKNLLKLKNLYWVLLIIILAFALRFLWLGLVPQIYFDEVNYLYDALKYQKGLLSLERESISVPKHPLLSIIFMQYGIILFGFNYLGWRIFSVIFGVLSIVAFYYLVKQLFSNRAAIIASFLLSIDFLHLVLSRIAMIEIYLFGFLMWGFCFLARSLKHEKSEGLLLAGTFFGLAMATKWVALLAIISGFLIHLAISKDPKKISRGLIRLVLFPLLLFVVVTLILNLSSGMNPLSWFQFEVRNFEYHQMFSYRHLFNASAWSWPLLLRSTPLFGSRMGENLTSFIIAFGNPAVYWLIIPVILYLIYELLKKRNHSLLFILIGFFGAYLPYLIYEYLGKIYQAPTRGLFFYYFLPAVPFYLSGLAYLLDNMLNNRKRKYFAIIYLILVAALFLYFSPLLYGFPVTPEYLKSLIWIKGWIN
jgi:dolichyl-phosphate-mannose--protein O-mannosyl transferase